MNCPLCNSNAPAPHYQWPDFDTLVCVQCGFEFINTEAAHYPSNAQYVFDEVGIGPSNPHQPHIRRRVADVLRFAKPPGRALDIGCGKGEVSLLLSQQGFQCVGIDMKEALINHLQQKYSSVTWRCTMSHELEAEGEQYDVITMYHVLEHIPNPVETLRCVRRLGKRGALLVVEVPNVGGLEAKLKGKNWHYYKVDHVNYFRPANLLKVAEQAELEILGLRGYQHFSYPQDVLWKDVVKGALAYMGFRDVISIFMRM
jgi:2-polyprenyl-3-methyl-5-hydroxy-6-metoxy-1,4-benzoquinol methylase